MDFETEFLMRGLNVCHPRVVCRDAEQNSSSLHAESVCPSGFVTKRVGSSLWITIRTSNKARLQFLHGYPS